MKIDDKRFFEREFTLGDDGQLLINGKPIDEYLKEEAAHVRGLAGLPEKSLSDRIYDSVAKKGGPGSGWFAPPKGTHEANEEEPGYGWGKGPSPKPTQKPKPPAPKPKQPPVRPLAESSFDAVNKRLATAKSEDEIDEIVAGAGGNYAGHTGNAEVGVYRVGDQYGAITKRDGGFLLTPLDPENVVFYLDEAARFLGVSMDTPENWSFNDFVLSEISPRGYAELTVRQAREAAVETILEGYRYRDGWDWDQMESTIGEIRETRGDGWDDLAIYTARGTAVSYRVLKEAMEQLRRES